MRSRLPGCLAFLALLMSSAAAAQTRSEKQGDLLLRVNAPVTIVEGDSASTVVVIVGDANVRGKVTDNLIVMRGRARITGIVARDILVARGVLELAPTARVGGNVTLYQSELRREQGAVVGGKVESRQAPAFGQWFALGFWAAMTVAIVAFGLLFAAVGGRQLSDAARIVVRQPGMAALSALVTWGGGIAILIFAVASVIGIPLGIGVAAFLLPALAFFGYVVTGTALGAAVLGRRRAQLAARPFAEVAVGLIILQAIGFIPVIGALAAFVAALMGAGALVYRAWVGLREQGQPEPAPAHMTR